jgi:thioester reductase-like protein
MAVTATEGAGTVLLTGFPGFLGERLLPRLLELRPRARYCCLVQPKFQALAQAALGHLESRHPGARQRVEIVSGDITEERLGLGPDQTNRLQREVTRCFHLAAVYDLAVARDLGMRVNVEGTRNVLRFLQQAPAFERLDYVSTAYVSGAATGVFRETDLDVGQHFKNFYEETKFLAEVAVVQSGLPYAVYRPGIVVGDSRTGETAKFDGPYFALTAMSRLPSPGVFVRIGSGRNTVNLVPSDFVIEALARLSTSVDATARVYHLTDPNPVSTLGIETLFARALGKRFAYLPVPRTLAKVLFSPAPVQRFFGMPVQTIDYFDHPCLYDATQATQALSAFGLSCPPFPDYVGRLVDFYKKKRGEVRTAAMV